MSASVELHVYVLILIVSRRQGKMKTQENDHLYSKRHDDDDDDVIL